MPTTTTRVEIRPFRRYKRVFADNESNNRAMISINDQLGFVKHPAWLHFLKSFTG